MSIPQAGNAEKKTRPTGDGWICTDPDTNQWAREVTEGTFEVFEDGEVRQFTPEDLSGAELDEAVSGYYDSFQEVKQTYGEGWPLIVAEILSEKAAI